MSNVSPHFEVFNNLFMISENAGYKTFDYLPSDKESYPFVFIAEQFKQDIRKVKSYQYSHLQQTIKVYDRLEKRSNVVRILDDLKARIESLSHTDNFTLEIIESTSEVGLDRSRSPAIWEGFLQINLKVQKRRNE